MRTSPNQQRRQTTYIRALRTGVLALLAFTALRTVAQVAPSSSPLTFDGASQDLKATVVVATLDAPIPPGRNVIWCSSFLAAWKALEHHLANGPVALEGSPDLAKALNQAPDPRPQIPEGSLYTAAGWNNRGIRQQIERELKEQFPHKPPPTFPRIDENSFVAYAYLEATVKFLVSYSQNEHPLIFTESSGRQVEVNSFGIPDTRDAATRSQPEVLFWKGKRRSFDPDLEFAVNLCGHSISNHVVVARIPRQATLAKALARVEEEIRRVGKSEKGLQKGKQAGLEEGDILLVPDFCWSITHRFKELEGRHFRNQKLAGQRLDDAQQDIFLRLDKRGVELRSESKLYREGVGMWLELNRPFLLYLKKRETSKPYFAMWVDNAELLSPWQGVNNPARESASDAPSSR